jgi:hypothetical protein
MLIPIHMAVTATRRAVEGAGPKPRTTHRRPTEPSTSLKGV